MVKEKEIIAIIDYGAGNLTNVKNMLDHLGCESIITSDSDEIESASKIILPGVGAFGHIMENLREKGLDESIKKVISDKKPFLGICIGLQVLFDESEESPGIKGLGIFKGKVKKFTKGKIPQIGWNNAIITKDYLDLNSGFTYFVNSFHVVPEDKNLIIFNTEYHEEFVSGIKKDNVLAVQFHPERSGEWGIDFLKKWLKGDING